MITVDHPWRSVVTSWAVIPGQGRGGPELHFWAGLLELVAETFATVLHTCPELGSARRSSAECRLERYKYRSTKWFILCWKCITKGVSFVVRFCSQFGQIGSKPITVGGQLFAKFHIFGRSTVVFAVIEQLLQKSDIAGDCLQFQLPSTCSFHPVFLLERRTIFKKLILRVAKVVFTSRTMLLIRRLAACKSSGFLLFKSLWRRASFSASSKMGALCLGGTADGLAGLVSLVPRYFGVSLMTPCCFSMLYASRIFGSDLRSIVHVYMMSRILCLIWMGVRWAWYLGETSLINSFKNRNFPISLWKAGPQDFTHCSRSCQRGTIINFVSKWSKALSSYC